MSTLRFTPSGVGEWTRPLLALVGALLVSAAPPLLAQAPQALTARDELEWMKSLALEGRLSFQSDQAEVLVPRLFAETFPDGRTWFQRIADDLAATGDWALLDDAISVCFAEADYLKLLAAAIAGTPEEATYNAIRKSYLEAAGTLLASYRNSANSAFDQHAGGLLGLPSIPDWAVPLLSPGEIQLREVAGAGRLNVETFDFSGRLSGLLQIPGLETTLAVPNFSFDSRGNIDLTAYGQTVLPPNDPNGVTLTIPPRRPLTMHFAADGNFAVAGGLRLGFPDGNVVDGFFDIDDPTYEFGLSFSGSATLELAREITLLRPTIDPATVYSAEAIDGFAQFFGAFGRGMETFLDDSPDLPSLSDLNVGVPPEFEVPQTSVPFDVLDAWIVGLANDQVRPALNGAADDALAEVGEMLGSLKGGITAARRQVAPTLNEIQRLHRLAEANGKTAAILKRSHDESLLANEEETDRLLGEAGAAALEAQDIAREYLDSLPADAPFKSGFAAVDLFLQANQDAVALGNPGLDPATVNSIVSKLGQWEAAALATHGLGPNGQVLDQGMVNALRPEDVRVLLNFAIGVNQAQTSLSIDEIPFPTPLMRALEALELAKVKKVYTQSISSGDHSTRARAAINLLHLDSVATSLSITRTPADRILMVAAVSETSKAIAGPNPTPADQQRAWQAIETARSEQELTHQSTLRRVDELIGHAPGTEPLAERLGFSFLEQSFFERWYRNIADRSEAGLIDAIRRGELEADLASFMKFFVRAQTARFTDATLIEQNLEEAYKALLIMTDLIAIAEDMLPEDMLPDDDALLGELQQNWEALHIAWVPLAEAKRMHWLLSNYAREIAAASTRYGDGLGDLLTDFQEYGSEAVAGLSRVIGYLSGIVNRIGSEPFRFALPGDIEIQRLYGELAFDRSVPDWALRFGGRLVFPDLSAVFEVPAATLNSDGTFSLAMNAASDTAFGLNDAFSLTLAIPSPGGTPFTGQLPFPSNGFTPLLNGFSGQGVLTHHLGGGVTETYRVEVDYSNLDPGHQFEVRSQFDGPQEVFTPELMLFNGAFGFNLETDLSGQPTQGGAELGLELGLLLRPPPPGTDPVPAQQRTPADYFLNFDGQAQLDFYNQPAQGNEPARHLVQVTLSSGTLTLPTDLFSGPGNTPPTIALLSPICVRFDFDDPNHLVSWCDLNGDPVRIAINNLGFKIAGVPESEVSAVSSTPDPAEVPDPETEIPGFEAGVSAVLLLSGTELPVIERISATLNFPLPGADAGDPAQDRLVSIGIDGTNWRLDGLPDAASINLRTDLHLVDYDAFDLFLLAGTGFSFTKVQVGNEERVEFSITGNIRGEIDQSFLAEDDADGGNFKLGGGATGSFTWDFVDPPQISISAVAFSGAMKLGGENGLELIGVDANGTPDPARTASIELIGFENIFALSETTRFEIKVNGAIGAAGVIYFGLKDARLVFDGIAEAPPGNTEPQFFVSAIGFREGENAVDLLGLEELPARLTAGSIAFNNETLSFPERLALSNLIFTVSGVVDLTLGEDGPRLFGAVENLQLTFPNGLEGTPTFSLNTLALEIENLTIGDMAGLSGGLVVGNLNDPPNLFFGGLLGGGYNGVGIKAIVAVRFGDGGTQPPKPPGLIGLCLKVNTGPVGIPLDGGAVGGIMLTGASGGVYFGNTFANPCEFLDAEHLGLDPETGNPPAAPSPARKSFQGKGTTPISELDVLTWDELAESNRRHRLLKEWRNELAKQDAPKPDGFGPLPRAPRKGDENPCPTGNCPPSTIGLLSQRHPSLGQEPSAANYDGEFAERIIYKFSSLDRDTVDDILALAGINLEGITPEDVGLAFAQATRDLIDDLIPRPGDPLPVEIQLEINTAIDEVLAAIQAELRTAVTGALNAVTGGESLLEALYKAAYAGIESLDVTILLDGTFSYAPVSVALSATGGAVASTTGTSGIMGSVNLVGIPVGTGEFYFSRTDEAGGFNPSFCGFMQAALGPLQLGRMDMALACPDCVTGVLREMLDFVTTLSGDLAASADPILRQFIADALGVDVEPSDVTELLPSYFGPAGTLTQDQQVAVMAAMLNLPEAVRFFEAHPELLSQFGLEAMRSLSEASIDLLLSIYDALNPSFTFCGEVEPQLFGFSLTGGNTLVAAKLFADKTNLAADVTFSPSYVLANLPFAIASGGLVTNVMPALDEATMGLSVGAPAFDRAAYELMTSQPFVYAEQQLDAFLANATLTFGYEFSPFGFKLADGEGRVILPTIANHPDNEERPDNEGLPGEGYPFIVPTAPSRDEVLKAALDANLLALATWQGDLGDLFPELSGKELGRDYFPHGGFLGAAKLQLPRPITDFPPVRDLDILFNPDSELNARFTAAENIANTYLLASDQVGTLTAYVPFPSPPAAFWTGTQKPAEFIDQITSLDVASLVGNPTEFIDYFFMRGDMQLDILGMPLAEGQLVADPALGLFEFSTSVPADSWLHDFVQGGVKVKIRSAEYITGIDPNNLPPGETPASLDPDTRLRAAFEAVLPNPGDPIPDPQAAIDLLVARLTDTLPKASMEATLGVDLNTAFAGAGLGDFVRFNSGAGFYAYSPRFEPNYPVGTPPEEIRFPDPDPNDPGPYTLARRNGGFVAAGNFNFGFNLKDPVEANRLEINIPEVAVAVTPGTANPFPNLSGRALVSQINFPSAPRFSNGLLAFNSNPDPNASLIRVEGTLEPFGIRIPNTSADILTLRGLNGNDLGATLQVTRSSASLTVNPAEALLPFLGPNVAISVFGNPLPPPGSPPPLPGDYQDFSFSSTPGEAWSATVCLSKRDPNPELPLFQICNPFDPADGSCSVSFTPNGPVCGTISGIGLQHFEMQLRIPNGFDATFFPTVLNPTHFTETTVHVGGDGFATLAIDSTGRFYVDFGQLDDVVLPGALTASGRLEFGFNPDGTSPRLDVTPTSPIAFGNADLNQTVVRQVVIENTGNANAQVGLTISSLTDSSLADYSLNATGFNLAPDATRTVDLTFHPSTTGDRDATLTIESNSEFTPVLTRDLTGTGVSVPRYVQSRDHIGFPLTAVGSISKASVTIGNAGSADMTISGVSSNDPDVFPVTPSGGFTLQPGEERLLLVSFLPDGTTDPGNPFTANLNISAGGTIGDHTVTLSGIGGEPQWTTLLDSSVTGSTTTLRDIKILADGTGWAVGDSGTFYETNDSGTSWTPRRMTSKSLHDIHVQTDTSSGLLAAYHFEEPPNSSYWRDDGPNGHHASTPSPGNRPRTGYDYGKVGSGLFFNNPAGSANNDSSDYVNLGVFDLPQSFAISLWVNPVNTRDGQFFVSKHTDSGANQFLFGFFVGGYWCATPMGSLTAGAKQTGWQHLVVNGSYDSGDDTTRLEIFRNGTSLGSKPLPGGMTSFNGGNPWVLGHEWDDQNVSDVYYGSMDELMFFGRALYDSEIAALARGEGGQKILLAGDNGTLLQSDSGGRSWHQVFDQNANGWRARLNTLVDYDWRGITTTSDGRTIVSGSSESVLSPRAPLVMIEDLFDPSPFTSNDEQFDEVNFQNPLSNEISNTVITQHNGRHFAFTNLGRVFTDSSGLGSTWQRHGSLNLPALHDAVGYGTSPFNFIPSAYLAVGDGGTIIHSADNANPTQIIHGVTNESLHGITSNDLVPLHSSAPAFHVVGDNGTYITAQNLGASPDDWSFVGNGLAGDNFGIDVRATFGKSGYTAWVAGEQNRIQQLDTDRLRPLFNPTFTFFPGQLDFGMIPLGQSRTLPLRLRNRGKSSLTIYNFTVSGPGFSLAQSTFGTLNSGEEVTLQVRYKPSTVSVFDLGQLGIHMFGKTVHVPLEGRCQDADWEPVILRTGGAAFDGSVIDLAYGQAGKEDTTVYALVSSPDRDRVFRSIDSGDSWSDITPSALGGQFYRFEGIDVRSSTIVSPAADIAVLAGALHNAGGIIDGCIMLSVHNGDDWNNRTPVDGVLLPFSDVAIFPDDAHANVMVCTSRGSGAEVWQTTNILSGANPWKLTKEGTNPSSGTPSFTGGRIALFPIIPINPTMDGVVVAVSSGNLVYARNFTGEWSGSPAQGLPTVSPLTSLHFGFRTSPFDLTHAWMIGHSGQFWRWAPLDPNHRSPFLTNTRWLPASSQEVFGTTPLEALASVGDHPTGYIVGGSRIFRTSDDGQSWNLDFEAGPGAALKSAATRPSLDGSWAGGSLAGRAAVWRQRKPPGANRPILSTNDIEFFAPVEPGQSTGSLNIELRNIGFGTLPIHHIRLESDDPINRFRLAGSPPSSIPQNPPVELPVVFDALPDPVDVAALSPSVMLRFEDGWDATTFTDHSGNLRAATAPANPDQRPAIFQDSDGGQRDRCLRFDGNNYAELSEPASLGGFFSIAFWANPGQLGRDQNFIGKHPPFGSNEFLIGLYKNKYQVRIDGTMLGDVVASTGWQHFVVIGRRSFFSGDTIVTFWRDGEERWQKTFPPVPWSSLTRKWVLGGDWDSNTMTDTLQGCLDDVAFFDRVLTEEEIRMLANKSPACGEHRARLVINSGSEDGERVVALRAEVLETSDLVVIDTVPSGQPITVDGIERTTPFAAAIRCTSTNPTEWVEGSLHTITAPPGFTVTDSQGNLLNHTFGGWSSGGGLTQTITARPGLPDLVATYLVKDVTAPAPGAPAPGQAPPDDPPLAPRKGPGFDFDTALAGAPAGPFLRLTNAQLTVGGLANDAFQVNVNGELFVSLTKLHAKLSSTALNIPNAAAGARVFELGPSDWLLDLEAGGDLLLKASPPSVTVLGQDLVPDGQFSLEMNARQPDRFNVAFHLKEDFRPLPDFVEFKKGRVSAEVLLTDGIPNPIPAFTFRFEGGLRVLRLPDGFAQSWAVDITNAFEFNTADFEIALSEILEQPTPLTLVNSAPWFIRGDLTLSRQAGGDITLTADLPTFQFNWFDIGSLTGSISTGTELNLTGTLTNSTMNLVSGGSFKLQNTVGGAPTFHTTIRALPTPRFRLELPALTLTSTATGFPAGGLALPGLTIDSAGAFDTGRLALPTFTFDNIRISKPSGGQLANNYIQLKRDSAGNITFDTRAQLKFLPIDGCTPDQFSLTIRNSSVAASYRGYFCVLPKPIALGYTPGLPCPLSGSAFGFTIHFGDPSCTGVSQSGLCILGNCP